MCVCVRTICASCVVQDAFDYGHLEKTVTETESKVRFECHYDDADTKDHRKNQHVYSHTLILYRRQHAFKQTKQIIQNNCIVVVQVLIDAIEDKLSRSIEDGPINLMEALIGLDTFVQNSFRCKCTYTASRAQH